MRKLFAVLLAATLLNSCSDKINDEVMVSTGLPMDGLQEVPPKMVAGNGTIDVTYNRNLRTLYYTVKWNSLTGVPTTGFGIYGSAGKGSRAPGPVMQAFTGFPASQAGTFSGTVFIDGIVFKEEDLLLGLYYINIPTAANPISAPIPPTPPNPFQSGEIRGQITGLK
ncbi:MAG TPA: CHRD domain-containing protein [Chitinophagaceae bacterium]|nr:CHRD domain-containing protein [Chitinophagaceae bacterium]